MAAHRGFGPKRIHGKAERSSRSQRSFVLVQLTVESTEVVARAESEVTFLSGAVIRLGFEIKQHALVEVVVALPADPMKSSAQNTITTFFTVVVAAFFGNRVRCR